MDAEEMNEIHTLDMYAINLDTDDPLCRVRRYNVSSIQERIESIFL